MKISDHGIGLSKALAVNRLDDEVEQQVCLALRSIEEEFDVYLTLPVGYLPELDEDVSERMVYDCIFPFLDRTGFILSGGDLQIIFGLQVNGKFREFSWREWGGYMSEWCNKTYNLKTTYIDFYMDCYVEKTFEDYSTFLNNLERIIKRKTE